MSQPRPAEQAATMVLVEGGLWRCSCHSHAGQTGVLLVSEYQKQSSIQAPRTVAKRITLQGQLVHSLGIQWTTCLSAQQHRHVFHKECLAAQQPSCVQVTPGTFAGKMDIVELQHRVLVCPIPFCCASMLRVCTDSQQLLL